MQVMNKQTDKDTDGVQAGVGEGKKKNELSVKDKSGRGGERKERKEAKSMHSISFSVIGRIKI